MQILLLAALLFPSPIGAQFHSEPLGNPSLQTKERALDAICAAYKELNEPQPYPANGRFIAKVDDRPQVHPSILANPIAAFVFLAVGALGWMSLAAGALALKCKGRSMDR